MDYNKDTVELHVKVCYDTPTMSDRRVWVSDYLLACLNQTYIAGMPKVGDLMKHAQASHSGGIKSWFYKLIAFHNSEDYKSNLKEADIDPDDDDVLNPGDIDVLNEVATLTLIESIKVVGEHIFIFGVTMDGVTCAIQMQFVDSDDDDSDDEDDDEDDEDDDDEDDDEDDEDLPETITRIEQLEVKVDEIAGVLMRLATIIESNQQIFNKHLEVIATMAENVTEIRDDVNKLKR